MNRPLPIIFLVLLFATAHAQQERLPADLRQHNLTTYNASLFNPAFSVGRNNPESVALWTRWQWQGIDANPTTLFLNYTRDLNERSAAGVGFFQHNTGIFFQTGAALNYAYTFEFNSNIKLSVGANLFGYRQTLADDRFQANPDFPLPFANETDDFILQMAPGASLEINRFSLSLASDNLVDYNFTAKEGNTATSDKVFMAMAAYDLPVTLGAASNSFLRPSIYMRTEPGQSNQFGANALLNTNGYYAQVGYNNFYGYALGGGYTFFKRVTIGATMEIGTSASLQKDTSFEIMASYFLGTPDERHRMIGADDDGGGNALQAIEDGQKATKDVDDSPESDTTAEVDKKLAKEKKAAEKQMKATEKEARKREKNVQDSVSQADKQVEKLAKKQDRELKKETSKMERQEKAEAQVMEQKQEAMKEAETAAKQQQIELDEEAEDMVKEQKANEKAMKQDAEAKEEAKRQNKAQKAEAEKEVELQKAAQDSLKKVEKEAELAAKQQQKELEKEAENMAKQKKANEKEARQAAKAKKEALAKEQKKAQVEEEKAETEKAARTDVEAASKAKKAEAIALKKAQQRRIDSVANARASAVKAATQMKKAEENKVDQTPVEALPGERYEEVQKEDGLLPGFYLIANVFSTTKYYSGFMADLKSKGLNPKSFTMPKSGYYYVFLKRYSNIKDARAARDSRFDGKYSGTTWVFRVLDN